MLQHNELLLLVSFTCSRVSFFFQCVSIIAPLFSAQGFVRTVDSSRRLHDDDPGHRHIIATWTDPRHGVLVVHLTMTIPLLDLIDVIPDDFEQRGARHHEPADPTDVLFWQHASAVPRAAYRTPTYAEWCLGRTAVQITLGQCTISMDGGPDSPLIAVCQGFHINAYQLISVILREHVSREVE